MSAAQLKQDTALNPDLAECLSYDSKQRVYILDHPLISIPCYREWMNHNLNILYDNKCEAMEEALTKADWWSYISLHAPAYRFEALTTALDSTAYNISFLLSRPGPALESYFCNRYNLIRKFWLNKDTVHPNTLGWAKIFKNNNKKQYLMTPEEQEAFASLPDELILYRGVGCSAAQRGISWTLNREIAVGYANRFGGMSGTPASLIEGLAAKSDFIAVIRDRGEDEIVVMPNLVKKTKAVTI